MGNDMTGQRQQGKVIDVLNILLNGFETVVKERGRKSRQAAHVAQTDLAMSPDAADHRIQFPAFEIAEGDALVHAVDDISQRALVEIQHGFESVRRLRHGQFVHARRLRGRSRPAILGVVVHVFRRRFAVDGFLHAAPQLAVRLNVVVVDELGVVQETIRAQFPAVALGIGADEGFVAVAVQRRVLGGDADDGVRATLPSVPGEFEEMDAAAVADFAADGVGAAGQVIPSHPQPIFGRFAAAAQVEIATLVVGIPRGGLVVGDGQTAEQRYAGWHGRFDAGSFRGFG